MSGPASRRGFLSGLAALPMIGGSVALVGAPTAAAEPITQELLYGYAEWLLLERRILMMDLVQDRELRDLSRPGNRLTEAFHLPPGGGWREVPKPSTRAALVLSAVGADWRY